MVMQHHEPECHGEIWGWRGAFFSVKVTVMAHMIKIWLFLLYFLNYWFLGSQSWSDDTSSYARVSCEKIGLLHSGSMSQQRVKMLMFARMISSKPPNILFPNLVLWCIIMSRSVMQKDWFAVFKFRVTVRAHLIKYDFLPYLLNCWSFGSQMYVIWWYIIVSWSVLCKY